MVPGAAVSSAPAGELEDQGGAVVGWTSAVGAYGPFTIGMLLAECGAGVMFAISTVIFIAILAINVYYYDRKNAPDLC